VWIEGFLIALSPTNLFYLLLGNFIGLVVGVLPAVGPAFGVALALPFTFGMDPVSALIFLCAIHATCSYGDSITSILINTPGSAISVPSCWDGFPLTQEGKGGMALGIAAVGSFTGGFVGWLLLVAVAQPITRFAIEIGAPEYFALAVMALGLVSLASKGETLKGILWACFGLAISFVGGDPITGLTSRFSLGVVWLEGGIPIIVSMLGLFAISQVTAMLYGGESIVQVKEAKDVALQFGKRCEVLVSLTADGDEIQVDILEGPQHRFGGGVVGGSRRITGKQAGQLLAALGQMSASDMLEQSQKAQANREQTRQPGGMAVIFQVHGRQTQRLAFQSAEAVFHQILLTVGENGLLQRELAFRTVGAIDSPA